MKNILKTAGIFNLLYYVLIISYAGICTTFAGFWLAAAAFFAALSTLPDKWLSRLKFPIGMGAVYFLFQEGRLLCSAHEKPKPGADYMIIMAPR